MVQSLMTGFQSSFHLGRINKRHLIGNLAFMSGMYQEDNPRIGAEIILLVPGHGPIDLMEGAGGSEYTKHHLNPNFDWKHAAAGFYSVVAGLPTFKFHNVPITPNTTYTKRVIAYNDRTEFFLSDNHGNSQTWYESADINNSGLQQRYSAKPHIP